MLKVFYRLLPPWIIVYYLWTTLPTRLVAIVWFGTLYLLSGVFIATKGKRILYVLSKDPWVLLLITLSGLSCLWSVDSSITFASFRSLIVQYILVGYLATTYSTQRIINFISKTLCFMGILSLIYVIFIPSRGLVVGQNGGVSWGGVFPHQSVLAATMALALISIMYSFVMERKKIRGKLPKVLMLAAACICLYLLFFCKSKTSLFGFIASFSIFPFFFLEKLRGMKTRNLIFIFLSYVFLIGLPLLYFSREFIIVDVLGKNPTLSGRSYLWEHLFARFLERPFGYGLDAFWHSKELADAVTTATGYSYGNSHSAYYDLLIGLGWPGVVLLSFFLITVIRRTTILAFKHRQIEFRWALQVIIVLLIASYSDVFIGFASPRTIGWFIFCIISIKSSLTLEKLKEAEIERSRYRSIYMSRRSQLS